MTYQPTSPRVRRPYQAGSTIVMGLVIMALGTLGVTAWVSLISARSVHIEGMDTAMKRRIALMNAQAATSEFLYRNALTKLTSTSTTITLPDGAGTVAVPALPEAPLGSFTRPGGVVRTGPANGYGYYVEMPITTTITIDDDGDAGTPTIDSTHNTDFLLKSRSPMLAGDLVSAHIPTLTPAQHMHVKGRVRVYGNTMVWASESPHHFDDIVYSETYSTYTAADPTSPDKVKDIAGNWWTQRNFASVPKTSGDFGTTNGFQGTLNAIDPGVSETWSMKNQILAGSYIAVDGATTFTFGTAVSSDGAGTVTINLEDIHLSNVLVGNGTRVLRLTGQANAIDFAAAGLRGAVTILVLQTSTTNDLEDVKCSDANNRRMVLAVKKTGDWEEVDMEFEDAGDDPTWRMLLVAENTRVRRMPGSPTGTVTMVGGVATDRHFDWRNATNKILHIARETDPKLLERLAPRMGWIEYYAN